MNLVAQQSKKGKTKFYAFSHKMKTLLFLSVIRSLYGLSCEDYPECNGPFLEQNPNLYCGIRVSNDTRTGPKCIYMLKARDKEPQSRTACAGLTYKEIGLTG